MLCLLLMRRHRDEGVRIKPRYESAKTGAGSAAHVGKMAAERTPGIVAAGVAARFECIWSKEASV